MKDEISIQKAAGVLRFSVYVQPRAASNQIAGTFGAALKVHLTAPPLEERANRQLIQFLAQCLGLPAGRFSLVKGHRSRRKTLTIQGVSEAKLRSLLTQYLV
jgi:uncharacterized protein (TIGR00251 family)